jgi:hypothetical protein
MKKKIKHINKQSTKKILQCICGRYVLTRRSQFAKYDIAYGSFLLGVVALALLVKAPVAFAIILLPIIVIPFTGIFVYWLSKGHSSKCSARWASIVILGSLGGYWL